MTIDSSGNVGIGTDSPTKPLSVFAGDGNGNVALTRTGTSETFTISTYFATASGNQFSLLTDTAHPLIFLTNSSEAMRIDSSGNVGIGTDSPSAQFTSYKSLNGDPQLGHFYNDNSGAAAEAVIYITNSSTLADGLFLQTYGANGTTAGGFVQDASIIGSGTGASGGLSIMTRANADMRFYTNGHTNERMRIDSSGRLGIGTSDPSSNTSTYYDDLVIKNDTSGTGAGITIQSNTTNGFGAVDFRKADGSQVGKIYASSGDGQLGFETAGSEAMRIDSSGNLLVGTTVAPNTLASASATQGVASNGSQGYMVAAASNQAAAYFNRQTSDGDIVEFRKDGTTVGSIGVDSTDIYIGTGDTGIRFNDAVNGVLPYNTSTGQTDATLDLGFSTVRWKDLYLSGGVYLGGTGSDNKLDDYEEGTFTTTLSPTAGTITLKADRDLVSYRKIGSMVWVTARVVVDSVSSPSGTDFFITNLPYIIKSPATDQETGGAGTVTYYDASVGDYITTPLPSVDGNVAGLSSQWRVFKDCSTIAADDQISFSFSYITT
jgi:hypothetical protein